MKTIILASSISALLASTALATVPATITDYLAEPKNIALESGFLPAETTEAASFIIGTVGHWEEIVGDLKTYAPDARRQTLVAIAAESLPPSDYLRFINKVCSKADKADGNVTNQFLHAILSAAMVKRGFLGYRYQDTKVASSLNNLKNSLHARKIDKWDQFFTSVFDGSVKAAITAEHVRDDIDLPEEVDGPGVLNE